MTKEILTDGLVEQSALFELTDRLYRARSLTEAYNIGIEGIIALLKCRRAAILQFDVENVMRFVAWRGLSDGYRKAVNGHSPWTRGLVDPEPLFIANFEQTAEPPELKNTIRSEGIQALAFVPLTLNRTCVGKFMAYFSEPHEFSEKEKQIALMIARQLSFCVERQTADFSASRLRALIGSSNDAIVAKDLNGIIQHWNPGAQRLFGYRSEEVVGKSITILIPEDRLEEEAHILGRLRKGESIEHYETVRKRKDGGLIHVSLTVSPIIDIDGRVVGASKIARDITEQHRARERQELLLREMNHRVKNLFSVTTSIVNLNARTASTVSELAESVTKRLGALGRSHSLTMANYMQSADSKFFELANAVLLPYESAGKARISLRGADFTVAGRLVTPISLLLHELATNAAKYGSLSNEVGQLNIEAASSDDKVEIIWTETGGPKPEFSGVLGFGSRLMEATLAQLNGQIEQQWLDNGLVVKLELRPS
ncbi:MAG: PAS domain S-box protein [Pseudomonadota bacterium]|nr:PAS domain S-box protein [Pseudomonadota bacterium]